MLNVVSDVFPCIEAELLSDRWLHDVHEVKSEHKLENTAFIYPEVTVKFYSVAIMDFFSLPVSLHN
jgi:hypothetical protein